MTKAKTKTDAHKKQHDVKQQPFHQEWDKNNPYVESCNPKTYKVENENPVYAVRTDVDMESNSNQKPGGDCIEEHTHTAFKTGTDLEEQE